MTTRTTGTDLIGATLLFSLLLHGVVILGVTFDAEKPKPSVANSSVRAAFLSKPAARPTGFGNFKPNTVRSRPWCW